MCVVLQDIMMDHPLRTISYIADIGDLVVLMARRIAQPSHADQVAPMRRMPRIICHVFESEEVGCSVCYASPRARARNLGDACKAQ